VLPATAALRVIDPPEQKVVALVVDKTEVGRGFTVTVDALEVAVPQELVATA